MKAKKFNTSQLVILGLMTAILFLMAYTPLGYLHLGFIEITFNVIPVAVSAIALGSTGGAVAGAVFGLTSFLQCFGIGGTSILGQSLLNINPFLTFILCFLPRILDGILLGYIFKAVRKLINVSAACMVTGFCSGFLNTLFFMVAMVLFFGNTAYMQELMGGKNVLAFICGFVGFNAIFEMIASTFITGAVGLALYKASLVSAPKR